MSNNSVSLRTPEMSDVDLLLEWENDVSIWLVSGTIVPFNRFQMEQYVMNSSQEIAISGQMRFMIDNDSKTIGTVDLFEYNQMHQRAGVGILIADKTERGKGYALQSLQELENYCRDILMLHQLHCSVQSSNKASVALFEKAGYIRCGFRKDWMRTAKGWEDEVLFQKLL